MNPIGWCTDTLNPTRGCVPVSAGCQHCYAATLANRFSHPGSAFEGLAKDGKWTGRVSFAPKELEVPGKTRRAQVYFVGSMSDLFIDHNSNERILAVFEMMCANPKHQFVILTKRTERMAEWLRWYHARVASQDLGFGVDAVLPNVWLGFSAEDQANFDRRMREAHTAAELGWKVIASLEPLIGPITMAGTPYRIEWVIVGGETGHGARPMLIDWARELMVECIERGWPFWFKQYGEWIADGWDSRRGVPVLRSFSSHEQWVSKAQSWLSEGHLCLDAKGRALHTGRDFKNADYPVAIFARAPRDVGRLLDGILHDDAPAPIASILRADARHHAVIAARRAKREATGSPTRRARRDPAPAQSEGVFA